MPTIVTDLGGRPALPDSAMGGTSQRHHARTKSSVLRSLMGGHKRNNSEGSALPSGLPSATETSTHVTTGYHVAAASVSDDIFSLGPDANNSTTYISAVPLRQQQIPFYEALGERHQNRQERSPERSPDRRGRNPDPRDTASMMPPPASPQKNSFAGISLKALGQKEHKSPSKPRKDRSESPTKPKKSKSATNLSALLRPKSIKSLKQLISDEEAREAKDKENRTPPSSVGGDGLHIMGPPPPIYAQFASQQAFGSTPQLCSGVNHTFDSISQRPILVEQPSTSRLRPKSFQAYVAQGQNDTTRSGASEGSIHAQRQSWARGAGGGGSGGRPKSSTAVASQQCSIDPKDIDKHLEALLDRRNIPENQRYKMRNLSDTIKMEFIRQDWAETQAKLERPGTNESGASTVDAAGGAAASDHDGTSGKKKDKKSSRGRGLSLTLVKGARQMGGSLSPKKQKMDGNLGRHFRTKSTESVASGEAPSPRGTSFSGHGAGFLAKVKGQQGPVDFVMYLRKVQQPELVEVGKLHKLRLLLRNETVAWAEEFIRQGGMKEIVELLHRIMAVEWREEHEDALLHENLLCLKALCTTAMALQYLHSIHTTLFPALLHMIFDPEKKGPSEFTTRNIITSILLTYIEYATPVERPSRARAVLGYLRDPQPKEEERPVDFVLEMRRERPYRVWCKETVSVTKEVFWIFLHNLNIVALPSDKKDSATSSTPAMAGHLRADRSMGGATTAAPHLETIGDEGAGRSSQERADRNNNNNKAGCSDMDSLLAYMGRHFPQERPPVPAAPYVGGVEWDATNYLASHLDLMNAILACTGPTAKERNALRAELRISGWERCLGGSLRLCKEKFYGAVHDGLRTWVAAAHEDGWDVRDVRYGPPPESRTASPVKKAGGGGGGPGAANKKREEAPKIEMPKLDFVVESSNILADSRCNDAWLS